MSEFVVIQCLRRGEVVGILVHSNNTNVLIDLLTDSFLQVTAPVGGETNAIFLFVLL